RPRSRAAGRPTVPEGAGAGRPGAAGAEPRPAGTGLRDAHAPPGPHASPAVGTGGSRLPRRRAEGRDGPGRAARGLGRRPGARGRGRPPDEPAAGADRARSGRLPQRGVGRGRLLGLRPAPGQPPQLADRPAPPGRGHVPGLRGDARAHSPEALFAEARRREDDADELLVEEGWEDEAAVRPALVPFPVRSVPEGPTPLDGLPLF